MRWQLHPECRPHLLAQRRVVLGPQQQRGHGELAPQRPIISWGRGEGGEGGRGGESGGTDATVAASGWQRQRPARQSGVGQQSQQHTKQLLWADGNSAAVPSCVPHPASSLLQRGRGAAGVHVYHCTVYKGRGRGAGTGGCTSQLPGSQRAARAAAGPGSALRGRRCMHDAAARSTASPHPTRRHTATHSS